MIGSFEEDIKAYRQMIADHIAGTGFGFLTDEDIVELRRLIALYEKICKRNTK